jgi:hypothetical protein
MSLRIPADGGFDIPLRTTPDLAEGATLLPVDYVSQGNTNNLCWAACCEMVLRANRVTNIRICDLAQIWAPSGSDCCADGNITSSACDQAFATPEQAYRQCNVPLADPNVPYQFAFQMPDLTREIATNRRPVEIYFLWSSGLTAHLALAIGVSGNGMLFINDPHYGRGWVAYDDVVNAYNLGGTWRQTWQGIGYSLGTLA